MKPFRDLPIQTKMLLMALLICGTVLLVTIPALFTFQVLNFRSSFQRDTATLAAVIANNSTAALAFDDAKTGAEVVGSLSANLTVVSACLTLPDGSRFAQFGKAEDDQSLAMFPPAGGSRFTREHLLYTQPVKLDGKQIGTLYLRSDFWQTFQELISLYGLLIVGVLIVSLGLAVFLSGRFRRIITDPILKLAETAQIVGEQQDYSVRAPVSRRSDELGRLTESFNEMLARIEEQDEAITLSQHKLEALVNSIEGIVWECEPDTFRYTFVSRQVERLLGYTPDTWLATPQFWQAKVHPEDAAHAIQLSRAAASAHKSYNSEYRMLAADGRAVWIRESGSVLVEHGRAVAVRGILLDVTAQKTAADELDRLNRRLLETSRLAGMAEVATGVLHNVGNVLNSVSVSATLVGDRLKQSKLTNLCRATTMLRGHNGHLGEFLTSDPKGKLLPEYLGSVSDHLAGEQTEMLREVALLSQNIEHIKEIVAMQQSYAKVSGAFENLNPTALLDDALRMNAAAFDRHRVQMIREYGADLPRVNVDRHKVLQILINLIRNAKYALDAGNPSDKRFVARVELGADGMVAIRLRDNGVGISPENLVKIFGHGFTTKKDGHGFGLHSGANAAKEMGGRLSAHSDGLGQGAEFTLELPAAKPTKANIS